MSDKKDIVKVGETSLAERDQHATRQLASWVAKAKASDFVDFRGKLFVPSAQTDKLGTMIGVSYTVLETERIPKSGYEEVTADGRTWSRFGYRRLVRVGLLCDGELIRYVDVDGMASSDDMTNAGTNTNVPVWTISDHTILTKAHTRACRNGMTRLAALKALDWDSVERAGGSRAQATVVPQRPDGGAK
jgi:hypothetical protein